MTTTKPVAGGEASHSFDQAKASGTVSDAVDEGVDKYGNPISGDEIIYCCFPDCGCDGARLCMARNGASAGACAINIERRNLPMLTGEQA